MGVNAFEKKTDFTDKYATTGTCIRKERLCSDNNRILLLYKFKSTVDPELIRCYCTYGQINEQIIY